jgi:hypothetical protein
MTDFEGGRREPPTNMSHTGAMNRGHLPRCPQFRNSRAVCVCGVPVDGWPAGEWTSPSAFVLHWFGDPSVVPHGFVEALRALVRREGTAETRASFMRVFVPSFLAAYAARHYDEACTLGIGDRLVAEVPVEDALHLGAEIWARVDPARSGY